MSTPDWEAIRADYVANGLSYRELGKKYGVSHATVARRAGKEGWMRQSATICDAVRNTVNTAIVEQKTDAMLTMLHAADTMAEVLDGLAHAAKRVLSDDAVNIKQVESLVRAININMETLSQLHGIPTQAQRHAQHLAEQRLAIERERLEMDKRKESQDNEQHTVHVVIDAPEGMDLDG